MLRHATRVIHERLHDLKSFRHLLAQTVTRDQYCELLESLYGFHQPVEAALLAYAQAPARLSMPARRRAHLLAEDLTALSPTGSGAVADLPRATLPIALLTQPGGFLGCLYVREGAMLGGRVLASKLDILLGGRTEGRKFFSGSANDAELWRSCCSTIDQVTSAAERAGMVSSALATFELFESWMTRTRTNHGVTE